MAVKGTQFSRSWRSSLPHFCAFVFNIDFSSIFSRFHVLRTYRRAALWKRKAERQRQQVFFAVIPAYCQKMPPRAKNVPTYVQLGAPKSRLERPKSRKKQTKGTTNATRCEKCAQAALKSEKCANIEPTWRNFGLPALPGEIPWPP